MEENFQPESRERCWQEKFQQCVESVRKEEQTWVERGTRALLEEVKGQKNVLVVKGKDILQEIRVAQHVIKLVGSAGK